MLCGGIMIPLKSSTHEWIGRKETFFRNNTERKHSGRTWIRQWMPTLPWQASCLRLAATASTRQRGTKMWSHSDPKKTPRPHPLVPARRLPPEPGSHKSSKRASRGDGDGSRLADCQNPHLYAVFLFLYFLFLFFTKIYFRYGNLQKYTPTAPLPGGRDLAARQQGLIRKKRRKKIADRSLGPAAWLRGGRPSPLYKVLAAPHPPFGLLKIQKKRKERYGWGRGKAAKPCRIFKPATLGN